MTPSKKAANAEPEVTAEPEDARLYEICLLYPNNLNQKEEKELFEEIKAVFKEAKAKELEKDAWGRRGLAYPIKGYTEAKITVIYLEMEPSQLQELNQNLKLIKNVLRHLTVKPPTGYKIEPYAGKYEEWLKEREQEDEDKVKEKEQKIKKQVADKAQRQVKRAKKADEPPAKTAPVDESAMTEEIDKLIADDELEL